MPFFQNPANDFIGVLLLGDRQLSLNFKVKGLGIDRFMTKTFEPYNLSGNTTLTVNFSGDGGKTYTRMAVNVAAGAVDATAVKAFEVVAAMNADATFSALYQPSVIKDGQGNSWVTFRPLRKRESWKTYVGNSSAESILRFNYHAGVAELPTYFRRHAIPANVSGVITGATNASPIIVTSTAHGLLTGSKIVITGVAGNTAANATWTVTSTGANTFSLDGSTGSGGYTAGGGWSWYVPANSCYQLIELDTTVPTDQVVITEAGWDYTVVQADYQLLKGNSGLFQFTKNTLDGSNRVTTSIIYPAGAVAGDFAKKITYTYSGAATTPSNTCEVPYMLTSGDLITP